MATLPSPLAAALGVVPAVLDGIRRLPGRAIQLPVLAVSNALATMDLVRREYDDLAERGERLVARLRGQAPHSLDELEDRVEDAVARTPFAGAYDKAEDALEDAAGLAQRGIAEVAPLAGRARGAAKKAAATTRQAAGASVEKAADTVEDAAASTLAASTPAASTPAASTPAGSTPAGSTPAAEAPKGVPTPKASEPDATRVDTAATPAVVEAVEQAAAGVSSAALAHDELPLPDYDHMTLGSLRGRMRSLTVEQLVQVRTYEKAHADRLPIVTMLDNRIAKLAGDGSATPSGPVPTSPAPGQGSTSTGSAVSPATTDAPPVNPPSQGVPSPAQPR